MTANRLPTPLPHSASGRADASGLYRRMRRRARTLLSLRYLYLLRAGLRFAPTEAQRLFALTVTIGVLCGLAAVAFHLTIAFFETHLIDEAMSAPGSSWIGWTLAVPILGGVACGCLLQFVVP